MGKNSEFMQKKPFDTKLDAKQNKIRMQNIAKRCEEKQLMRKNDAKYAKKCVFCFAKTCRTHGKQIQFSMSFASMRTFFLRNRRTLIQTHLVGKIRI